MYTTFALALIAHAAFAQPPARTIDCCLSRRTFTFTSSEYIVEYGVDRMNADFGTCGAAALGAVSSYSQYCYGTPDPGSCVLADPVATFSVQIDGDAGNLMDAPITTGVSTFENSFFSQSGPYTSFGGQQSFNLLPGGGSWSAIHRSVRCGDVRTAGREVSSEDTSSFYALGKEAGSSLGSFNLQPNMFVQTLGDPAHADFGLKVTAEFVHYHEAPDANPNPCSDFPAVPCTPESTIVQSVSFFEINSVFVDGGGNPSALRSLVQGFVVYACDADGMEPFGWFDELGLTDADPSEEVLLLRVEDATVLSADLLTESVMIRGRSVTRTELSADANGDGLVDHGDRAFIIDRLGLGIQQFITDTLIGYEFGADAEPDGDVDSDDYLTLSAMIHAQLACFADLTGVGGPPSVPDQQVTIDDLIAFLNAFSDDHLLADVCGIGGASVVPDAQLTVDDVIAFVNAYADGCS